MNHLENDIYFNKLWIPFCVFAIKRITTLIRARRWQIGAISQAAVFNKPIHRAFTIASTLGSHRRAFGRFREMINHKLRGDFSRLPCARTFGRRSEQKIRFDIYTVRIISFSRAVDHRCGPQHIFQIGVSLDRRLGFSLSRYGSYRPISHYITHTNITNMKVRLYIPISRLNRWNSQPTSNLECR